MIIICVQFYMKSKTKKILMYSQLKIIENIKI